MPRTRQHWMDAEMLLETDTFCCIARGDRSQSNSVLPLHCQTNLTVLSSCSMLREKRKLGKQLPFLSPQKEQLGQVKMCPCTNRNWQELFWRVTWLCRVQKHFFVFACEARDHLDQLKVRHLLTKAKQHQHIDITHPKESLVSKDTSHFQLMTLANTQHESREKPGFH